MGDFALKGRELRLKGQNRIGNLIVENRNYCEFEDWLNVSWNDFHFCRQECSPGLVAGIPYVQFFSARV